MTDRRSSRQHRAFITSRSRNHENTTNKTQIQRSNSGSQRSIAEREPPCHQSFYPKPLTSGKRKRSRSAKYPSLRMNSTFASSSSSPRKLAVSSMTPDDFLVVGLEKIQPAYAQFEGKMFAGAIPMDNGSRTGNTQFWLFQPDTQSVPDTIVVSTYRIVCTVRIFDMTRTSSAFRHLLEVNFYDHTLLWTRS